MAANNVYSPPSPTLPACHKYEGVSSQDIEFADEPGGFDECQAVISEEHPHIIPASSPSGTGRCAINVQYIICISVGALDKLQWVQLTEGVSSR